MNVVAKMKFDKQVLKSLMAKKDMSIDALRDEFKLLSIEVSTEAIRSWIYRGTSPSFENAVTLAKIFGVSTDDFANK